MWEREEDFSFAHCKIMLLQNWDRERKKADSNGYYNLSLLMKPEKKVSDTSYYFLLYVAVSLAVSIQNFN